MPPHAPRPTYTYTLVFTVLVILFIISKVAYLSLPYYWDEAWSYAMALGHMLEKGVTLVPHANLDPEITRGHPLFYYAFMCAGLKLAGNTIFVGHALNLFIAVLLLIAVYYIVGKAYGCFTGCVAAVLLVVQELFWIQSVLVLPEMMLTLFIILALYNLYKQHKAWYVLYATLAMMVKESALAVAATGVLYAYFINRRFVFTKDRLITNLYVFIPIAFFIVFVLFNYRAYEWFVYPGHTALISLNLDIVMSKLDTQGFVIFASENRRLITLCIIAAIALWIYRHKVVLPLLNRKEVLLIFSYAVALMFFSCLNFFISRYILTLVVILCITGAVAFCYLVRNRYVAAALLLSFGLLDYQTMITNRSTADSSVGYADEVEVTQKISRYFEEVSGNRPYGLKCGFLMRFYLAHPALGYVTKQLSVDSLVHDSVKDYYLISTTAEKVYIGNSTFHALNLVEQKRFTKNKSQAILYKSVSR